jgi:hypothetical protein
VKSGPVKSGFIFPIPRLPAGKGYGVVSAMGL